MGLSTVTVSVKEFEDLIENKKKLQKIREVVEDNKKYNIIPATAKMLALSATGKWKEAHDVADEADELNLKTLTKICEILIEKGGAGNEKI